MSEAARSIEEAAACLTNVQPGRSSQVIETTEKIQIFFIINSALLHDFSTTIFNEQIKKHDSFLFLYGFHNISKIQPLRRVETGRVVHWQAR